MARSGDDPYACQAADIAAGESPVAKATTDRLQNFAKQSLGRGLTASEMSAVRLDLANAYAAYIGPTEAGGKRPSALAISAQHWAVFDRFGLPAAFGGTPFGSTFAAIFGPSFYKEYPPPVGGWLVSEVQPRLSVYIGRPSMTGSSRRTLIVITVLLMAPAVLLLLFGLPQIVAAFVGLVANGTLSASSMSRDAIVGCLKIIGGVLALLELGRLSLWTIGGKKYRFGIRFLGAFALGIVATHYTYALFGPELALILLVPLLFLTYRMWKLQREITNDRAARGA